MAKLKRCQNLANFYCSGLAALRVPIQKNVQNFFTRTWRIPGPIYLRFFGCPKINSLWPNRDSSTMNWIKRWKRWWFHPQNPINFHPRYLTKLYPKSWKVATLRFRSKMGALLKDFLTKNLCSYWDATNFFPASVESCLEISKIRLPKIQRSFGSKGCEFCLHTKLPCKSRQSSHAHISYLQISSLKLRFSALFVMTDVAKAQGWQATARNLTLPVY